MTERGERSERILIYCTIQTKKKWMKYVIESGARNNEEALNTLLEIYEMVKTLTGAREAIEAKKKLERMIKEKQATIKM